MDTFYNVVQVILVILGLVALARLVFGKWDE